MLTWVMHLTLFVPGLLWPREILRDTTFDLPLPALSRLLGRGRRTVLTGEEAWLTDAFGIGTPLPAAALRLLGDGGKPGHDEWLCLDPVHLRLHEWAVIPDDPATLQLTAEEDAALRDAVTPLFAGFGDLVATAPGRWHLRLAQPAAIETRPLPAAVGRAVEPALPGGPQGEEWRRRLAEVQPLLHAHRVNHQRIKEGRSTVNHLWPWGGGYLPQRAARNFDHVWTDDPVLKGLAMLAGADVAATPVRFSAATDRVLARLDGLVAASASLDAMAWRAELARLEADWFAPAIDTVRRGVSRRLTFVAGGNDRAIRATASGADLWCLWRRPLPLAELAP